MFNLPITLDFVYTIHIHIYIHHISRKRKQDLGIVGAGNWGIGEMGGWMDG